METKEIRIEENGLKVIFEVHENGIVELKQFTTAGKPDRNREPFLAFFIIGISIPGVDLHYIMDQTHKHDSGNINRLIGILP